MPRLGLRQHSGRVISLGRLMLALLFLVAIWLDASQPVQAETETYGLLGAYVLVALAIAAVTWNDWWRDARLAAPAHLLDIGMFTVLVFATEGYTSPFFLFFVFLLLSAAIRWGWRQTAITAGSVIILYLTAGLLVATSGADQFELQRFIIRSGHLVILSAILIWFGTDQRSRRSGPIEFAPASPDEPPLETALLSAIAVTRASSGVLLWRASGSANPVALTFGGGELNVHTMPGSLIRWHGGKGPFLYDLRRNHALTRGASSRLIFGKAEDWLVANAAAPQGVSEGLAIPLQTDTGQGELFLESVEDLSIDHLEVGEQIAREFADHIHGHALLRAVEESGEARARLSLARDFHDSVVQFLAAAAFRLEGMILDARAEGQASSDLEELKRLMLQEQDDLRSFIGALRSGREIELPQLASELHSLADKLSRQWEIDCSFSGDVPQRLIPMRLHLDALQLVRESVANAVRHGRATAVRIHLTAEDAAVRLELRDNGNGFPAAATLSTHSNDVHPRSLKERIQDAGGELMLVTLKQGTSLEIILPIRGRQ